MSSFSEQLEQIKSLIFSASKSEKSFAYSSLQHLQGQATGDTTLIQLLADSNKHFLSSIIAEIRIEDTDEEICTLALKCLGFIIYHPSLVPSIPKDCVFQVLESLARLIITTKVKVVCNLGVWCVSIQQLDASYLAYHFDSLLRAIVHSLDNPVGSLSITFEAIQAVIKLTTQISEKMKDSSNIWAPSIYRRLLSADKRERDMCLRCLLKIKHLIVPPHLSLSKVIAKDIKLVLLPEMEEMLKHGKKVHALQAWGWFIRILGHYSLKSRHLVNELLKIPEQTFSDPDPQIQIATLVAWEGLIDALVYHHVELSDDTSQANGDITQTGAYSKSLKLIMTPVIGIMTSKAGLSVHSSCLNTWCYLLHKLDSLVKDPHIIGLVVEPMLKVVFNIKLDDENIWMWNFCMDLLIDFIHSKSASRGSHTLVNGTKSPTPTDDANHLLGESTLKNYFVRWLPWDHSHMDFIVRTIQMIFCQAAAAVAATLCPANKRLVCDTALRIFRIFLKGVQKDFAESSTSYDTVMQSINYILVFVKTLCDTALCVDDATDDFKLTCLRCLEAVSQELDPSILSSPLYKVALDMKSISTGEFGCNILQGINPINYMDMIPPIIYLSVHHFYLVVQLCYREATVGSSLQEAYNYFSGVLSLTDSLEVIHAIVVLLYGHINHSLLRVWITLAQCLKECIDSAKDLRPVSALPASSGSFTLCYFLIYPVVVCTSEKQAGTQKQCDSLKAPVYFTEKLSLEQVTEVWISLYCLLNSTSLQKHQSKNSFAEDLCSSMNGFLHQRSDTEKVDTEKSENNPHYINILSLCSSVAECILNNLHIEKVTPEAIKSGYTKESSSIKNCLEFISRLMNLVVRNNEVRDHILSRLLPPLSCLVGRLQWKEDIVSLFKVLCDPLVSCLSDYEINNEGIQNQLQTLWKEIIRSLQRSWPSIEFDSSFLNLQASLLERTLGHPNPSISEPTITFWNSAYGDKVYLDFPPCLLHVLDKLLRAGKLEARNRRASAVEKGSSSLECIASLPKQRVTATLNMCSKRVKLPENGVDGSPSKNKLLPCLKRKTSEHTEHQKEVRRAQQGRLRDCSSHGPGVRTYTTADFSQGNQEDSQDSQDIRHPELILDLLRRTG